MLFVDVDLPPVKPRSLLRRWFSSAPPPVEDETLAKIRQGLQDSSGSIFRIYRTAAGFRLLATERFYEPGSAASTSACVRSSSSTTESPESVTPLGWCEGNDVRPRLADASHGREISE